MIPKLDPLDETNVKVLLAHIAKLTEMLEALLPDSSGVENLIRAFALTTPEATILAFLASRDLASIRATRTAGYVKGDLDTVETVRVRVHRLRVKLLPHGMKIRNKWGWGYYLSAADRQKVKDIMKGELP